LAEEPEAGRSCAASRDPRERRQPGDNIMPSNKRKNRRKNREIVLDVAITTDAREYV
jgi:hypothetical protein